MNIKTANLRKVILNSLLMPMAISCSKQETPEPPTTGQSMLFILAGQSNAEGAVFLEGLLGLQEAVPPGPAALTPEEQKEARTAVARSLGVFCELEPHCLENLEACADIPFSFSAADAVISALQRSSINWRDITADYVHKTTKLHAFNYRNAPVAILDANAQEVDNEDCIFSPEDTTLQGPVLDVHTPDQTVSLGPGYGAETEDGALSFGPELGFGIKIAQTVGDPTILKMTMGGSTLHDGWRKSGTLYQSLIAEIQETLQANTMVLGGFIWFQGFNDQFEDVYCRPIPNNYEANLRQFLANVRNDLNAPDLPFVIVEARDGGDLPIIQNAQNAVVASDPRAAIVVSKDLSDCFHYDSGSQLVIGERVGVAMEGLLEN